MADPKYANLPGIAHDQPDVYETAELPECDHYPSDADDPSDFVETLHIAARIKNKEQEHIAWIGEYELAGSKSDSKETETPLQKYQRLNCEVRELLEELDLAKQHETDNMNGGKAGQSLIGVASQTSQLQEQLSKLKLEERLGSDVVKQLNDPRGTAKDKLFAKLNAVKDVTGGPMGKENLATKPKGTVDGSVDQSKVMYELLMKPEAAKLEEHIQVAEVEKRVENIEKLMAFSSDKLSALTIETNQKTVPGVVGVLGSRLSLLSPSHLDHIEGRMAALLQKMNTAAERKTTIDDAEKQGKIEELYDLCVKTDANSLSDIVDRLDALQSLHESALKFTKAISQLDTVQQKLETNMSNNGTMLKETQIKFNENLLSIQRNFDNLEERLNNLKK